jgi:transposase InsO family protein
VRTKQGWTVNVKRIYRLYKQAGLLVRRLRRKRLVRVAPVNAHLAAANHEWALDYNSERPHSSLGYRTSEEYARTRSGLTSRIAAIPPDRPSVLPGARTAVLAGKDSLIAAT